MCLSPLNDYAALIFQGFLRSEMYLRFVLQFLPFSALVKCPIRDSNPATRLSILPIAPRRISVVTIGLVEPGQDSNLYEPFGPGSLVLRLIPFLV